MTIITKSNKNLLYSHKKTDSEKLFTKFQFYKEQNEYIFHWIKIIFGIFLIIISLIKLIRNESKSISVSKTYEEVLKSRLLPNAELLLPQNEGKLIHVMGYLNIPLPLEDDDYGVSIRAVKLKRRVQMYQWVENKISHVEDFDDNSFQYKEAWKDKLINSSNFFQPKAHQNPITFPIESEIRINSKVFLGSFIISEELKEKFKDYTEFTSGERPIINSGIKMHMGLYYHASDIWKPVIGDCRIQFSFAGLTESIVSVIGKQVNGKLEPFLTSDGTTKIAYVKEGQKSIIEILQDEFSSTTYEIWSTRLISGILLLVGFYISIKPNIQKYKDHKKQ